MFIAGTTKFDDYSVPASQSRERLSWADGEVMSSADASEFQKHTDYAPVKVISQQFHCTETTIRDFARTAGVKPRYLLTTQMFSFTELQLALFSEPTKKGKSCQS